MNFNVGDLVKFKTDVISGIWKITKFYSKKRYVSLVRQGTNEELEWKIEVKMLVKYV